MSPPTRAFALSLAALALSACAAVGPDFHAPAAPTAKGYAMAGDPAPASVRLDPDLRAAGPWWRAFGSPALDETVRLALADSPTIAETDAALARAQAAAAAARGAGLPQADADATAQRERINTQAFGFSGFPSPTINLYSIGASVSYDLDLFGGRRRAVEQAQAEAQAAERHADAAYLALSGNVAVQAARVAALSGQLEAARAMIEDDRRIGEMIDKAEAAGGSAPSARSALEIELAEDLGDIPPLERELAAARHQLALLVGRAPGNWTAPDFALDDLAWPGAAPAVLPSALVRRRPDILAAEAELHAATAAVGVAVADQYPDIRLTASLTQSAISPEKLFDYGASGWDLAAGTTAPLFHGGVLKARRQAAEAQARAALARYQQTVLRAFVQVSDLLAALAADENELAARTRAVDAATADLDSAQAAWRLGGGALIKVAEAQRQLNDARRDLAEARGRRLIDLMQLHVALAADWS